MNLFFELVRVSVGVSECLSRVPSVEEWKQLYEMSVKQALTGICFAGVQKLPAEMLPPRPLVLRWIAFSENIKCRNLLLDDKAKELTGLFSSGGFRTAILKGQGVAALYPDSLANLRQSGDIDLWVDGGRDKVLDFAGSLGKVAKVDFKHADLLWSDNVEVELHFTPTWFYSPINYHRFRVWMNSIKDGQFEVSELGFATPAIKFNLIYSLIHIYKHLFDEGVGLRQLMDYYFILLHSSRAERDEAFSTLSHFGMGRFVGAAMYVLKDIFGLEDGYMLCRPSGKYGSQFLRIILDGGNFGRFDKRNRHGKENTLQRGIRNIRRNFQLISTYPSEVIWAPFWKIWHLCWRKAKGYQFLNQAPFNR